MYSRDFSLDPNLILEQLDRLDDPDQYARITSAIIDGNPGQLGRRDLNALLDIFCALGMINLNERNHASTVRFGVREGGLIPVRNAENSQLTHTEKKAEEEKQAVVDFADHAQNTHNQEVKTSLTNSVVKLKKRYHITNPQVTFEEVKRFIRKSNFPKKVKQDGYACLRRIKRFQNQGTSQWDLTIMEILNLAWQACSDIHAASPGEMTPLDNTAIEARRRGLIQALSEAMHANNDGRLPACPPGTCNKLIEHLNLVHPDVNIVTGASMAVGAAADKAKVLALAEFKKLSLEEQRAIYLDWDEGDINSPKSAIGKFFVKMKPVVIKQLVDEFKNLVDPRTIKDYVDGLEYGMPKPNIYKPLDDLMQVINDLPQSNDDSLISHFVTALKAKASHAYQDTDRALSEIFALLDRYFKLYLAVKDNTQINLSIESLVESRKQLIGYVSEDEMNKIVLPCLELLVKNKFSHHFQVLENYGNEMQKTGYGRAGAQVKKIAADLQKSLTDVTARKDLSFEQKYQDLKTSINNVLNEKTTKSLAKYRPALGTIFANIAIAITVAGLFFIAGKLIHSKVTTGRALFFNQKPTTHREELVANIKRELVA